jgi:hypothetical protein
MSMDISDAFVTQFESEVKLAYQRQGSKLSNTVRKKTGVKNKTTFQKVGKGEAGTKSRHGLVPLMTLDHTPVEVSMTDYFAADYVDKLDELRVQHDERAVITATAASALGRKSDDILTTAMAAGISTYNIPAGGTGLTEAKVLARMEAFSNLSIPDDGDRYWLIPPQGWSDLLAIQGFANADYVGSDDLPWKGGMSAKRWLSFMFIPIESAALPLGAGGATEAKTLAYHRTAVGFAVGEDVKNEISWHSDRHAHLVKSWLQQGAVVIDELGVHGVDMVL